MRGDDQDDDHHERNSHKYQDYGGDAHEDPVLACLPLPVLRRDFGPGRMIAGGIVQIDASGPGIPGAPSPRATEPDRRASRSARRDQYAVKLTSLIPAEQGDLEPLTWEWPAYHGGLPELTGDADADGTPGVMSLPDDRCHRRHIGAGHGDYESVQVGPFRLARWGPVGEDRGDRGGRDHDRRAGRTRRPGWRTI